MTLLNYPSSIHQQLLADDETTGAENLIQLCRQCPELRHWLLGEFVQNPKVRTNFVQVLDNKLESLSIGPKWLASLSGEDQSWQKEKFRLKAQTLSEQPPSYGGLTFAEVGRLMRRYQAGTLDPSAFALAQEWANVGSAAKNSLRLSRAAASLIDATVQSGSPKLLRHFAKALSFLKEYRSKPKRRAVLGADWWKLQTLLYILRHPKESYTTREFKGHLGKLGTEITPKDLRRFCKRHSISRDMRAGRPRKKLSLIGAARTQTIAP